MNYAVCIVRRDGPLKGRVRGSRSFYVITLRSGVKKEDLKKFLETEWIPATRSTPGCLEVELWDDHQDRAGYHVCELWENKEVHFQNVTKLWNVDKKDVYLKLAKYGIMELRFSGDVIDSERRF